MKLKSFIVMWSCLLIMLIALPTWSAGEDEYVLGFSIQSMMPRFGSGHEGDLNQVTGFGFTGRLLFGESDIGSVTGEATAANPPMSYTDVYENWFIQFTYDLPGVGTFVVTGQGIALSSSTGPTQGDMVITFAGSMSNGTGVFVNSWGLASGTAIGNFLLGTGNGKQVFRIRWENF